jgi:type IV secretion system protein VirB9
MRALVAIAAVTALAGCASHQLSECRPNKPNFALNSPALDPSVWDDGASTYFRFPGNARIPAFYVVNPDGRQAVPNYNVDPSSNLVTVHQIAAEFRLRDGDQVMCVFNNAPNPVGFKTDTNTTSPAIERTLKRTGM